MGRMIRQWTSEEMGNWYDHKILWYECSWMGTVGSFEPVTQSIFLLYSVAINLM